MVTKPGSTGPRVGRRPAESPSPRSDRANRVTCQPLTQTCADIYAQREHVLIGMSLGNGYFTTARITELVRWASAEFEEFHLVVLGPPFAASLQAVGHTAAAAQAKAADKERLILRRAALALAACGVPEPSKRIITWTDLADLPGYLRLRDRVRKAIDRNSAFRAAIAGFAEEFIERKELRDDIPHERRIELAADYVIAELPLLLDTPAVLGYDTSIFTYHAVNTFAERLWTRQLALTPAAGQGFVVSAISGADDRARPCGSAADI